MKDGYNDYQMNMFITEEDFKYAFNRKPKNVEEFKEFCDFVKEAIQEQINWNETLEYVREGME